MQSIYVVKFKHKTGKVLYKVGITEYRDVRNRFAQLYPERVGYKDFKILEITSSKTDKAKTLEKSLLHKYKRLDIITYLDTLYDTHTLTGYTEFIDIDEEDYEDIKSIIQSIESVSKDIDKFYISSKMYLGILKSEYIYLVKNPSNIVVNNIELDFEVLKNQFAYSDSNYIRYPKKSWSLAIV